MIAYSIFGVDPPSSGDELAQISVREGLFRRGRHANLTTMKGDVDTPQKRPVAPISWTDAAILGGAVLGILIGISLLSPQLAVAMGVFALGFVIYKLFTTKP